MGLGFTLAGDRCKIDTLYSTCYLKWEVEVLNVFDCIKTRRTVRNFKPDPIPEDIVYRIMEAARWSPSSSNSQPWHFVVISDDNILKSLGGIATQGPFIANAPLAIAVVMENAFRPGLDAGRAIQQMELMAWSEGLGTCFVGFREVEQQEKVKELLGIPSELELITVLPFGYREEGQRGRGTPRKPMQEIAHRNRFGETYAVGQG